MDEMSTPPKECLRPPPAQLYIIMYISTEGTTDNDDIVPLLATHKQATMEHEKVCICMRTLKDTISLGTTRDYAVLEWKLKLELTTTR